jgi:dephospho-CoA kinase
MIVGLTGGIASGKTTVANFFISKGVDAVDADIVARQLVEPGRKALELIENHFGKDVLDKNGELDRPWLRRIIFANETERLWLDELLHPLIRAEMTRQLKACRSPYQLLIAPLLLENQLQPMVDRVLVVDVPIELQIKRTQARDGVSDEQAKQILKTQLPREQRLAAADDIIKNTGSLEAIKQRVDELHSFYLHLSHDTDKCSN